MKTPGVPVRLSRCQPKGSPPAPLLSTLYFRIPSPATAVATLRFNEAFISKFLGHKDHSVTRRYIDIAMSPLHDAAERYGETVVCIVGGSERDQPANGGRK